MLDGESNARDQAVSGVSGLLSKEGVDGRPDKRRDEKDDPMLSLSDRRRGRSKLHQKSARRPPRRPPGPARPRGATAAVARNR